jgi:molecular chaperone GrpE (heat shock protein)
MERFEKNLKEYKELSIAKFLNDKLNIIDRFEKKIVEIDDNIKKIEELKFIPISEGSYYEFK